MPATTTPAVVSQSCMIADSTRQSASRQVFGQRQHVGELPGGVDPRDGLSRELLDCGYGAEAGFAHLLLTSYSSGYVRALVLG